MDDGSGGDVTVSITVNTTTTTSTVLDSYTADLNFRSLCQNDAALQVLSDDGTTYPGSISLLLEGDYENQDIYVRVNRYCVWLYIYFWDIYCQVFCSTLPFALTFRLVAHMRAFLAGGSTPNSSDGTGSSDVFTNSYGYFNFYGCTPFFTFLEWLKDLIAEDDTNFVSLSLNLSSTSESVSEVNE